MKKAEFWAKEYRRNIGKLVGVCYRYVGDWQVAEDLAQDAFLKAMEKGSSYHAWGSFEGWLKKIAVNEALMYLRDRPEMGVKQRTVFNLYAVEHWSHKQIAKELGISVTNSKVLLSRARTELQGMLTAMRIKKLRN